MRDAIVSGGVAGLVGGVIVAAAIVITGGQGGVSEPIEVYGSVDANVTGAVNADISESFKQVDATGGTWGLPVTIQDSVVPVGGASTTFGGSTGIQVEVVNQPDVNIANSGQFQAVPVYVAR